MKDKNLSQQVLETIKENIIKPRPRWHFLLKNYLVWFFGITSLLIGSVAFSVIIYMFLNNDWNVYKNINDSLLEFILVTLPNFWLLFLGLFIFITHYNIRHTKKGYRFKLSTIVLGSVCLSILLGTFFYNIGLGYTIDSALTDRLPIYRKFLNPRMMIWNQAENGLLVGMIINIDKENNLRIIDFNKKEWQVITDQAIVMIEVELKNGMRIKIIGEMIDENSFKAYRIMPAFPKRPPLPRFNFMRPVLERPLPPPNF